MSSKNILSRQGYIINKKKLSIDQLKKIKEDLTVKPYVNKDYTPEVNSYPIYEEDSKSITIPRYYGQTNFGSDLKKKKMKPEKRKFKFNGKLREYQTNIVDVCLKIIKSNGGGIISLPCGRGKTIIAIYLACVLKIKTLVVVHKTFLQNQWYERIKQFSDAKIGIIRQKKKDVENKDIVIGMLQSISMIDYDPKIFDGFGLVIFDEVHHTGSRVFCKSLKKLGFKYTIGLSATPYRNDGLTKVIKWYLGDIIYKEKVKNTIDVDVKTIHFSSNDKLFKEKRRWIQGSVKPDMVKMITNLCKIDERNKLIAKIINILRHQKDRKILVLSGRLNHLTILKELVDDQIKKDEDNGLLDKYEQKTSFYIGKMKDYELEDAEEADVIFATYEMAEEGLDIPALNTLIFGTTKKKIEQCVGRILRKKDDDKLIIDIVDMFSRFIGHGSMRKKFYSKQKYNIEDYTFRDGNFISNKEVIREEMDLSKEEFEEVFSDAEDTPTDINHILKMQEKCNEENIKCN